jgi:hypothetical protein
MKTIKVVMLMAMAVLVAAAMIVSCAREKPSAESKLPGDSIKAESNVLADGDGTKFTRIDNMYGTRFIELFLAIKDPKTGNVVAPCYNTMLTSKGIPESKNTAPQDLVEGLDLEKIAKEYGVLKASLNGPKIWFPDWIEIETGMEREFNGMTLAWCAQLNMSDFSIENNVPYQPTTIKRTSKWGWKKGTQALILDDPDGNVWIMKGFQLGLKPEHTLEEFVAAGQSNFTKLPPGWKFRVTILENDVIEIPVSGVADIMPDEFFNVYDRCGEGMTNYTP